MIDGELCRAARGLLGWSQQQLAETANTGLSTVKKFEAGTGRPIPNNLSAIRAALEGGGVIFLSEDDGGPGIVKQRFRIRGYVPGEGLHLEIHYTDLQLVPPDNEFELWCRLGDVELAKLAGRQITDEADAKNVARKNQTLIIAAAKKDIGENGLSGGLARPRNLSIVGL